MPLRPFRAPYNIGVDICHIPRVIRALTRKSPDGEFSITSQRAHWAASINWKFVTKVLRPEEVAIFHKVCLKSWITYRRKVFDYFAGRWAAKEAVIKAAPRKLTFRDVVVFNDALGIPRAAILSPSSQAHLTYPDYSKLLEETLDPLVENSTSSVDTSDGKNWAPAILDKLPQGRDRSKTAPSEVDMSSETSNISGIISQTEFEDDVSPDVLMQRLDGEMVTVSITHDHEYAVATAMYCFDTQPSSDQDDVQSGPKSK